MTYDFLPSVAAPLARLIQEFHKLPGIGPKMAQRITYYLVRMPLAESQALAEAITAPSIYAIKFAVSIIHSDPEL